MRAGSATFVTIFCVVLLAVSVVNADKPEKPPKPEKPDKEPGLTTECITFSGDLQSAGETIIVGCCPNAGPWPAYTMELATGSGLDGIHDGYLFVNFFGTGPTAEFVVKFWTWDADSETPGTGDYFFQIIGGEITRDRKSKTLTVEYENETGTGWIYDDLGDTIEIPIPNVSFVLFRSSDLSYCE
jgi:hypothetical protein